MSRLSPQERERVERAVAELLERRAIIMADKTRTERQRLNACRELRRRIAGRYCIAEGYFDLAVAARLVT